MATLTVNYTTDPSATGGYRVRYRKLGSSDPYTEETTTANPFTKAGLTAVGYEGDISSICGSGVYSTTATFSGCSPIACSAGTSDVYTGLTTYTYPNKILLDLSSYTTGATYTSAAGATGSTTTITVDSTTGLVAGMFVEVTAGTGQFTSGTTVSSITNSTEFEVSTAPTTALSGGATVIKAYTNRIELAFNTFSTYVNTANGTRPASWIMYKNGSQVATQSYVGVMPGSGSWGSVLNNAGPKYSYGLTNYNYGNSIYTSAAGATSSGKTITVTSTTGLVAGMIVKVSSGTGAFATLTRVSSITDSTTFVVDKTPTTALSGGATVVKGYDAYEIEVTVAEAVSGNPSNCSWSLSLNCANTASAPAPTGTTYYALSRCGTTTGTVYFTDTVINNSGQLVLSGGGVYYRYTPQNNAVNQTSPPANYIGTVTLLSGQFNCP